MIEVILFCIFLTTFFYQIARDLWKSIETVQGGKKRTFIIGDFFFLLCFVIILFTCGYIITWQEFLGLDSDLMSTLQLLLGGITFLLLADVIQIMFFKSTEKYT